MKNVRHFHRLFSGSRRREHNGLLFVHIPKTAGTSFRQALAEEMGEEKLCLDYGETSPVTSKIVSEVLYEQNDYYGFRKAFTKSGYLCLCGHFSLQKFSNLIGLRNSIAFVRHPVQRVLSEYNHFKNNYGYKGDLYQFSNQEINRNKQSKYLKKLPWPALGLLGVTEKYEQSLCVFEDIFDLKLTNIRTNLGDYRQSETDNIDGELEQHIITRNQKDLALYQFAVQQIEVRQKLQSGKKYVHGELQRMNGKNVTGWAFSREGSEAAEIELLVNNRLVDRTKAKLFRPHLMTLGFPRDGYVGFSFNGLNLKPGDTVDCRVVETQQTLSGSVRVFNG